MQKAKWTEWKRRCKELVNVMNACHSKCLMRGCKEKPRARGLCKADYASALHAIKKGRTTWSTLLRRGLALPARPYVRRLSAFLKGKKP